MSVISNENGEFEISNISEGTYYLEINQLGFIKFRTQEIEIKNGENILLENIYLKFGDLNVDNQIDILDLVILNEQYSSIVNNENTMYDFNSDSKIDELDREQLVVNYGMIYENKNIEYTKNYTISYNMNGGNGSIVEQYKIAGEECRLSSTIPTKSGYEFLGWTTTLNSNVVNYSANALYNIDEPIMLYAVWKDSSAPNTPVIEVISGTMGSTASWYKSSVGIRITATDLGDGVSYIEYTLSGAVNSSDDMQNGGTLTISKEGTTRITAIAYDYAGNPSNAVIETINIDIEAPVISNLVLKNANVSANRQTVQLSATCSESLSNINFQYSLDGGNYWGYSNTFDVNSSTSRTLQLRAIDKAGNISNVLVLKDYYTGGGYASVQIIQAYEKMLNRTPTAAEVNNVSSTAPYGMKEKIAYVLTSSEANALPIETFLSRIYPAIFGRSASASELDYIHNIYSLYGEGNPTRGRGKVIENVINDDEFDPILQGLGFGGTEGDLIITDY